MLQYFDFNTFYFSFLCGVGLGFITYYQFFHDNIHSRFFPTYRKKKRVAFFTLMFLMLIKSIAFLAIVIIVKFIINRIS